MTKLHRTLEKLYYLVDNVDPDNLTDRTVEKIRKVISKCQRFTKENIEFYSLDRLEAAKIIKQSKIIARIAREKQSMLYTLDLKGTHSEIEADFDLIKIIVSNIELALSGPNNIYSAQYIATVMAIENNFIFEPEGKNPNNMSIEYANRYFDRYGITIEPGTIRKEYIDQFPYKEIPSEDTPQRVFYGAKKEIERKIIKVILSKSHFKKLHNYQYNSIE